MNWEESCKCPTAAAHQQLKHANILTHVFKSIKSDVVTAYYTYKHEVSMSTSFPIKSHKGTPVLNKCSLTFSRKTKALLKKKKNLVLNKIHQNSQTCQAACTLEFCSV